VHIRFDPGDFGPNLSQKKIRDRDGSQNPNDRYNNEEFDECESCYDDSNDVSVDGPYLYENERAVPRAYFVDHAVLVLGKDARDATYEVMMHPSFNPATSAIVTGKSLDDHDQD